MKVTLEELRSRALDHADMTGSGFPDTARLDGYLNVGLGEVHDLLALHDYLRLTHSITLASGTEAYALPGDFLKASKVWLLESGRRHMIDRFNLSQLNGMKTTGPASSGSAELWYVPRFARLTQPTDAVSYDLPDGWDELAPLHAAIQLINREGTDPQALMAERERIKARIVAHVEPRDPGTPDEIEDHYNRWGYGAPVGTGTTLRYRIMGAHIHFVDFGTEV